MSTESVKYQLTLCQDIKGVVFDKEETIFKTGEVIQLSYDQYRSMCANAYTYISVNIAQGHNIAVKIHLDDIGVVYRYKTTKDIVNIKTYNPEEEFPD